MNVFDYLHDIMAQVIDRQRTLVSNMHHMKNVDIIADSAEIFNKLRSYIKIEENLVFPALEATFKTEPVVEIDCAREIHDEIERIMDSSTMMHVDEPSDEYGVNMENLLELLERYRRHDEHMLLPMAKRRLDDKTMASIGDRVKDELWHEALGVPPMTS